MPRIFEQTIIEDDDSFGFECQGHVFRRTADGELEPVEPARSTDCFRSSGWPTAEIAQARADEHAQEHMAGTLMSSLEDFRAKHELVAEGSKAVKAKKE